jgi:hypothetical protein
MILRVLRIIKEAYVEQSRSSLDHERSVLVLRGVLWIMKEAFWF